jgi:hypothetical protein
MRLVEICVDGGLEATMYSAQGQLADAYIAAGAANEARFIAEDLVAREPWEKENVERFRRALVLLGEPDRMRSSPRGWRESPFMSTDLFSTADFPSRSRRRRSRKRTGACARPPCWRPRPKPSIPPRSRATVRRKHEEHHFELSSNAIDLDSILGDRQASSTAHAAPTTSRSI